MTGFADALAAVIEAIGLGPAHVAGLSWGGTVVLELYRRHPRLVATLIMIDTYAGWKGSLPADEVAARVAGARQMLAARISASTPHFPDSSPPSRHLSSCHCWQPSPPTSGPDTLRRQLAITAEADLSDLLPHIAVPTLLIWGQLDARSPLTVAYQFQQTIADTKLVVIEGAGT